MLKRLLMIAVVSAFLLSGCGGNAEQESSNQSSASTSSSFFSESSSDIPPVSSTDTSSGSISQSGFTAPSSGPLSKNIQGHSIKELGLSFRPEFMEFENDKIHYIFVWNDTSHNYSAIGNRTIIEVSYQSEPSALDAAMTELMALWGFLKSEIKEDSVTTWSGRDKYAMKDLEPFKVYENDDVVVYDVWELVNGKTVEAHLGTMGNENVSPAELIDAYEQVKEYPGGILGLAE